jgi:hypothetical protein
LATPAKDTSLEEILAMFGLPDGNAGRILRDLTSAATYKNEQGEP